VSVTAGAVITSTFTRIIGGEAEGCIWNLFYEDQFSGKRTPYRVGFGCDCIAFMLVSSKTILSDHF
jgi:hypothetical protein